MHRPEQSGQQIVYGFTRRVYWPARRKRNDWRRRMKIRAACQVVHGAWVKTGQLPLDKAVVRPDVQCERQQHVAEPQPVASPGRSLAHWEWLSLIQKR